MIVEMQNKVKMQHTYAQIKRKNTDETNLVINRETNRQKERQTERETDRKRDRQKEMSTI